MFDNDKKCYFCYKTSTAQYAAGIAFCTTHQNNYGKWFHKQKKLNYPLSDYIEFEKRNQSIDIWK